MSLFAVFEVGFPGGIGLENVKWRAFVWAISEGILILAVLINYLPPRFYSMIFRFSIGLMMVDFLLCLIWLPIGVSKTYGFRSAQEVFTMTCKFLVSTFPSLILAVSHPDNGTGAPAGWNWILSLYVISFSEKDCLGRTSRQPFHCRDLDRF